MATKSFWGLFMNCFLTSVRAGVILLTLAGAAYPGGAFAGSQSSDDNDVVFDADEAPFGTSYSQWTARLWQHMLSIPAPLSQFTEGAVNACSTGQNGPVWFLAGKLFVGGTSIRSCTLPANKALLFPVHSSIIIDTPHICGQEASMTVQEMRAFNTAGVDALKSMSVELDGKPINGLRDRRYKSRVFDVALPDDNIFNQYCGGPGTVPGGVYAPSVDEGYYLMLQPLSEGGHTLRIRSSDVKGFEQDVTYHLSVLPKVKR
jgi:hypothetical protein